MFFLSQQCQKVHKVFFEKFSKTRSWLYSNPGDQLWSCSSLEKGNVTWQFLVHGGVLWDCTSFWTLENVPKAYSDDTAHHWLMTAKIMSLVKGASDKLDQIKSRQQCPIKNKRKSQKKSQLELIFVLFLSIPENMCPAWCGRWWRPRHSLCSSSEWICTKTHVPNRNTEEK